MIEEVRYICQRCFKPFLAPPMARRRYCPLCVGEEKGKRTRTRSDKGKKRKIKKRGRPKRKEVKDERVNSDMSRLQD